MKTPDLHEGKPSAPDKRNFITADSLQARLMAGEIIAATDYDEDIRPQFWSAIARVRDDMPRVRETWHTLNEQHVDGVRVRQKRFCIRPLRNESVAPTLADEWSAADHLAREIPRLHGAAKHQAISELLAKLLELLRGDSWN